MLHTVDEIFWVTILVRFEYIYVKLFNHIKRVCIYILCADNINIMYADIS